MKQRMVLIISVVIGLIAFWLTREYFQARSREFAKEREELLSAERRMDVLAAGHELPAGTVIQKKDLKMKPSLARDVGKNTVLPDEVEQIIGKKLKYSMDTGETVLWSYVDVPYRPGSGLGPMVSTGMRAFSIAISGAAGVSGLLRPNDRVDVLGSFTFPSKANAQQMEWVTLTILQDVTILATGQMLAGGRDEAGSRSVSGGYNTVTMEVTPREAELLAFVENIRGHLTLALRNPGDVSYERDLPQINFDKLQDELPELNSYRQTKIRRKGAN